MRPVFAIGLIMLILGLSLLFFPQSALTVSLRRDWEIAPLLPGLACTGTGLALVILSIVMLLPERTTFRRARYTQAEKERIQVHDIEILERLGKGEPVRSIAERIALRTDTHPAEVEEHIRQLLPDGPRPSGEA